MMKTMEYKNVIITLGATNAVIVTEASFKQGGYKVISEASSFIAALKALDYMLDRVANNDTITKEITRIYVPDMLKGFTRDTFMAYLRTNKTSSGREFSKEEQELVLQVAHKMMNKGFNMQVVESKFMLKELAPMKNAAIKVAQELKAKAPKAAPVAAPQATVDPVAQLGLQIADAAAKGDMATVATLTAALTALQAAKPAQTTAPVVEETEELEDNEVELDEELMNMDC